MAGLSRNAPLTQRPFPAPTSRERVPPMTPPPARCITFSTPNLTTCKQKKNWPRTPRERVPGLSLGACKMQKVPLNMRRVHRSPHSPFRGGGGYQLIHLLSHPPLQFSTEALSTRFPLGLFSSLLLRLLQRSDPQKCSSGEKRQLSGCPGPGRGVTASELPTKGCCLAGRGGPLGAGGLQPVPVDILKEPPRSPRAPRDVCRGNKPGEKSVCLRAFFPTARASRGAGPLLEARLAPSPHLSSGGGAEEGRPA